MPVLLPLIAGAGLLGAGWLGGKAGGGGVDISTELFTSKKYKTITETFAPTYAPTITKTFDISTTYITDSPYAQVVSKKEQAISQQPTVSPQISIVPVTGGTVGGTGGGIAGFNIWDGVILAGIVIGAYYIIKKIK